jgi:adenosylcobinamide-GDP ribazoletransferase
MRARGSLDGLLGAVSFLTRVPAGARAAQPRELARLVPWFPLVGALVGLAVAGLYAALGALLPPLPAAAAAVTAGIALTGALHEDGLGDTADAFLGAADREATLRILDDPRLGTFGVVAVAASLLLRVAALAAIAPAWALAALPAAHALSRAAAVAAMAAFPPATGTGLGAAAARALDRRRALLGAAGGVALAGLLLGVLALAAAALAGAAALWLGRLSRRRIGGVTGDVLGAAQQAAEVLTLLVAAAAGTWHSPVSWLLAS